MMPRQYVTLPSQCKAIGAVRFAANYGVHGDDKFETTSSGSGQLRRNIFSTQQHSAWLHATTRYAALRKNTHVGLGAVIGFTRQV
jgi:hypothetical protein